MKDGACNGFRVSLSGPIYCPTNIQTATVTTCGGDELIAFGQPDLFKEGVNHVFETLYEKKRYPLKEGPVRFYKVLGSRHKKLKCYAREKAVRIITTMESTKTITSYLHPQ